MSDRTTRAILIISVLLNAALLIALASDRVEHRKRALGNVSFAEAARSYASTRLLPRVKFEVVVADTAPIPGAKTYQSSTGRETFYAIGEAVLTNEDIQAASVDRGVFGEPAVRLIFTTEGAEKLRRATAANDRKHLLFIVDNEILMAPVIMGAVAERETLVTGSWTPEEINRIVLAFARK